MRIAIRCDSSSRIGGGHVGRCLALAERLRRTGNDVVFLCRPLDGARMEDITTRGFPLIRLPAEEDDAEASAQAVADGSFDWIVVDHHGLGAAWEARMRPFARRVLVIDDLADRPHDCDILLDAGRRGDDAGDYSGFVPAAADVLLGPRFALLRPEFDVRRPPKVDSGRIDILVFFSSADASDQTGKALDVAAILADRPYRFHVVVGAANRRRSVLGERMRALPNVVAYDGVADMAALLAGMDMAVGSGGVSAWERCRMGVPSLVVTLAGNQEGTIATAETAGAIRHLGHGTAISAENLARAIDNLASDADARARMAEAGRRLVDGQGARRLAALMGPLTLAPAAMADARLLWTWANDPAVRANAFNEDPIPWEGHLVWLERKLGDAGCLILIGREGGVPAGQVRFELDGGRAVVDIAVDSARRGAGYGLELLLKGVAAARRRWPAAIPVAFVKHGNKASRAIFLGAGFVESPSPRGDAGFYTFPTERRLHAESPPTCATCRVESINVGERVAG